MADTTSSSSKDHTSDDQSAQNQYVLNRDYAACVRLNFQHYLWKRELGFNIHPSITLPEHAQIADVASGSTIWAIEVAEANPTAQITAFDISQTQSPPQAWLPPSIHLQQWDMTDPNGPPGKYKGKFDLVHIRLVILVLEDDATSLIQNLLQLLKPGGYLQWDEADFVSSNIMHPAVTTMTDASAVAQKTPSMHLLAGVMAERSNKEWAVNLPTVLEQHGFTNVKKDRYVPDRIMLKFATDSILMVWDEIIGKMPDSMAERRATLSKLVEGTKVDAAGGGVIAIHKDVTVAMKTPQT